MGKLLFFLVLFAVVALLVRMHGSRSSKRDDPPDRKTSARMIRCARCGVFHAEAETILRNGSTYCCDDHARQGPRS